MNRGLLYKSFRETWVATVIFGAGLCLAEGLLVYVLATFHEEFAGQILQLSFVRNFVQALLGTDLGAGLKPGTLISVAWVHPVILALVWGQEIMHCTRLPAGELDRGTIDVLFGLPVSRRQMYLSESATWLLSGVFILSLAFVGASVSSRAIAENLRPDPGRLVVVLINFYCLYLAVGGLACLVSSLSDRRGRAIAVVFATVLASFLLNFLAQFWTPAKDIAWLSALTYYRPVFILNGDTWPVKDMLTLAGFGAACWLAGGIAFGRRNICTV